MVESIPDRMNIEAEAIEEFCSRWQVTELSVLGSVLRDDFRPDSDVDLLVEFAPGSGTSLFDLLTMRDELAGIFGREIDLVEKGGLENPFRRQSILESRVLLYAE